jgi:outer membrane receptor for ferrienterochelin and colicin
MNVSGAVKKSYFKRLMVLMVMLFGIPLVFAGQTGKVTGRIVDSVTKEPVIGANVVVSGTYLGAAADENGEYIIANIPPGTYKLVVSSIGYVKTTIDKVVIRIDQTTHTDVTLTPQSVQITKEVFITATRPMVQKDITSTNSIISSEDLKSLPVEDMSSVVNLQAGVVDGHFRGGRSGEVAYLVDGIPVTDIYNGSMGLRVENSSIREMEVISGTFNAEYGQAMSGVVNTVTQDGGDQYQVDAQAYVGNMFTSHTDLFMNLGKVARVETRDLEFTLSGPTGLTGLTFFTTGRYYKDDGYLFGKRVYKMTDNNAYLPTGNGEYLAMNPDRRYTVNGKLTYSIDKLKLSYSIFWNDRQYKNYDHGYSWAPDGIQNHYQSSTMQYFQLSHIPNARFMQTLKVSYMYYGYKDYLYEDPFDSRYLSPYAGEAQTSYTFRHGGTDGSRTERNTRTILGQYNLSDQIDKHHKIGLGAEVKLHQLFNHSTNLVLLSDSTLGYPADGTIGESGSNTQYRKYPVEGAAYIQDKIEYDIMIINAGVRFDYFDPNAWMPVDKRNPTRNPDFAGCDQWTKASVKKQVSPRFGVSFPITESGILRFSYGHFFQIPNFENLYTNPSFKVIPGQSLSSVLGNPDLGVQKTVMYEIGLQQVLFDILSVNLSFYSRDIRNLLGMEIVNTYEGFKYARFINRDYANVRGFIVTVEKRMSNYFSAKVDYTYQIAEGNASDPYAVYNNNQTNPPVEESKTVLPLDWDQRHTLNASVNFGQEDWNVGLLFQYGSGLPYTEDIKVSQGVRFENGGVKPATYSLDLRAEKTFDFNKMHLKVFMLVYNILDIKNELSVYGSTGRANSDLNTQYYKDSDIVGTNTIAQYLLDPSMYSSPRDIRIGFGLSF